MSITVSSSLHASHEIKSMLRQTNMVETVVRWSTFIHLSDDIVAVPVVLGVDVVDLLDVLLVSNRIQLLPLFLESFLL